LKKNSIKNNNSEELKIQQLVDEKIAHSQYSNISLYPNPVIDKLIVNGLTKFSISIYDLYGRHLFNADKVTASIDVSNLTPGIYLIHLKSEGKSYIYKIVKQ